MKKVITSEAISTGGRSGSVETTDGLLKATLGNPLEKGIERRGPNPEHLFAAAYSACYHGALQNAAKTLGVELRDSKIRAVVHLLEDHSGGYHLSVELHGILPGVDPAQAQRVMEQAHQTCPYSRALRGEAQVKLIVG